METMETMETTTTKQNASLKTDTKPLTTTILFINSIKEFIETFMFAFPECEKLKALHKKFIKDIVPDVVAQNELAKTLYNDMRLLDIESFMIYEDKIIPSFFRDIGFKEKCLSVLREEGKEEGEEQIKFALEHVKNIYRNAGMCVLIPDAIKEEALKLSRETTTLAKDGKLPSMQNFFSKIEKQMKDAVEIMDGDKKEILFTDLAKFSGFLEATFELPSPHSSSFKDYNISGIVMRVYDKNE